MDLKTCSCWRPVLVYYLVLQLLVPTFVMYTKVHIGQWLHVPHCTGSTLRFLVCSSGGSACVIFDKVICNILGN